MFWSLVYHPLRGQAETRTAGIVGAKRAVLTQEAITVEQSDALSRRAEQHWVKGEYARAENLWQRALTIQERTLGPEHPNVAITLYSLARLYQERGEYARAESLWQRALVIQERMLGSEHPNVAATLHSLAGLYLAKGEYERVEPLLQRTLAIEEKTLGPEHPHVATTLHSLAYFFQIKGEYDRAEPFFQRALAIEMKALGPEDPTVAATFHSLATLYLAKGDYDRAEPLFQQALAIQEKVGGPEHPHVATILDSLAGLYVTKGDYDHAEPLFQRALAIWQKRLGPEHPNVATTLNNLAELYREKREYGRAEPLFQQALAIWQKRLGPEHPNVATALHNLATLYREQGEYGKAEPLFQRALAIREKELGPEHPTVAATLHGLAVLYAVQGAEARAIALQTRCNDIREHYLTLLLATGSEEEKRAYLATFTEETHFTLSLHFHFAPQDQQAARLALTTVLRRKGRVLDALTDSLITLRRHLSSDDQAALAQLATLRAQLANGVLKGLGSLDSPQYRARMVQVEAQAQELEAQISTRSAAFRAQSHLVTIGEVQRYIPLGAALVEFVLYKPFPLAVQNPTDRWGAAHYAVYVLRREGDLAWVDLGDAAPIDRAIAQLRRALSDPDYPEVQTLARALDELVMRPVRQVLGDTRLLLLSPDGELNLLPFGVLVDEEYHYLIERLTFITLPSGRDLLRLAAKSASRQSPVIVASPDFNSSRSSLAVAPVSTKWEDGAQGLAPWSDLRFMPLDGTAGEAAALKRLLPEATILTGTAATETALKQIQGPLILHIATHGFFVTNHEDEVLKGLGFVKLPSIDSLEYPAPPRWENSLLRSGLALAGANQPGSGGEDGLLTALEAAGLDLWGTKLVVLSACETGTGDIQNGEGVYGLRRAIGVAGTESQVMSLWKVGDAATRDLMVAYYANLILGEGRAEGLRHVQLQMLRSTKWNHPFYWASFIQSGDWTPIEELQPDLSVQGMRRALAAQFYHHCPSLFCW